MTLPGRSPAPRRVRITSPRRQAVRRPNRRAPAAEIDEQTALGEVYIDALLAAQLRLSGRVLGAVLLLVAAGVAIVLLVPQAHDARIGPVPWTWILLGGLSYAVLLLASLAYLRAAERLEREFSALVRPD